MGKIVLRGVHLVGFRDYGLGDIRMTRLGNFKDSGYRIITMVGLRLAGVRQRAFITSAQGLMHCFKPFKLHFLAKCMFFRDFELTQIRDLYVFELAFQILFLNNF